MFGPELLVLRETSDDAPNLQKILRQFKVPAGLNEAERAQINKIFMSEAEKQKEASWFGRLSSFMSPSQQTMTETETGSKVIYLMAPDNKFLNFYRLELAERELAYQLIEDISYDIG